MSSTGQKTKQESLEEYEKNYLTKLEEASKPKEVTPPHGAPDSLQNFIYQFSAQIKKHELKDYIGHCVVCLKEVDRKEMKYKDNFLFHPDCYALHGSKFEIEDPSINEAKRAKIDLVYLKNLQVRNANQKEIEKLKRKADSQKKKAPSKRNKSPKRKAKRKTSVKRKKAKKKKTTRKKVVRKKTKRKTIKKKRKSTTKPRKSRKRVTKKRSRTRRRR